MRLLIVEDDPSMYALMAGYLTEAGLATDHVTNAADARVTLSSTTYDAIVLDLGLPDQDGSGLLLELRARNDSTPVLVVTARDQVDDCVEVLGRGADDYLRKPFDSRELIARIRSLLRRPSIYLGRLLEFGNISLDVATRQVSIANQPVIFRPREFELLEHLMRRAGRVVRKNFLEESLYGIANDISSNSLEVAMHRVRKLLESNRSTAMVQTVRGVGYVLTE
jgi:DNA-binding response OmpR family regulator